MDTAGSFIYTRLLVAENDFRTQCEDAADMQRTLKEGIEQLTLKRAETLLALAQELLPEAIADDTQLQLGEVLTELMQAKARCEEDRKDLLQQRETAIAEIENLKQRFADSSREHAEFVADQQRKQQEATRILQNNPQFVQQSAATLKTQKTLHNNELRVEELHRQAEAQLPAYRNSRLFQYLIMRRYGSSDYEASFLTRRMDSWIARLIDFPKAIRSFNFLRTVPVRMREEVKKRKRDFDKSLAELRKLEDQVGNQSGLRLAAQKVSASERRRLEVAEVLAAAETRLNEIEAQLEAIESPQGKHFAKATAAFSEWLASLKVSVLEDLADETESAVDDRLVAEIQLCDEQVQQAREDIRKCEERARDRREKMMGMQWVLGQFRAKHYDADNSVFDASLDIDTLIQRFDDGKSIKESLWAGIEGRQREKQSWSSGAMGKVGAVASHPTSQALLFAVANIAGQAAAAAIGQRMMGKK